MPAREENSVVDCLRNAMRRDAEKGGDGFRTTREVAEWCGIPIATARRRLWAAVGRREAMAFDGGASGTSGNPILWRQHVGSTAHDNIPGSR
jgi:hypothetical protein